MLFVSKSLLNKLFNVASTLFLGWYDVTTSNHVETTLFTSMMEFTTLSSVESTLSISTLIWTTSGNVETTLPFSTSVYSTLNHVEITLWIWPLKKWKNKLRVKNIIILFSFNKNHLNWIPWTQNLLHFVPLLRNRCRKMVARP